MKTNYDELKGKRLLVLGGTTATYDLVQNAKAMGITTIVSDYLPAGVTKEIADETADISTTDIEGLCALIKERNIDGVFCGPSEFNIRNLLKVCEHSGMPCYTTTAIWDHCANKDVFKQYCREYGVDCAPEYDVSEDSDIETLAALDYPIIVKPVDSHSSRGITVCTEPSQVPDALAYARQASGSGRIIVEKYIQAEKNGQYEGRLFGVRYIVRDGEAYPYLMMDTYIVDPVNRKSLISAFTHTPSQDADYYMVNMDAKVRAMIKGMGIRNGVLFFQSLPCDGKIYFHEMGYRLSGGMLYKITEPLTHINDMRMMIRFALGGEMITDEEIAQIDLTHGGKVGAQIMVPLQPGKIKYIEGLDDLADMPCVVDFLQYYHEGDTVTKEAMGTLGQHFGRYTMIADDEMTIRRAVDRIQDQLVIIDEEGRQMNRTPFDFARV